MPEQEKQTHSELASFGEELRREREIRGISLKEIADATKVSKRFLEAIERNDHRTLPAPVFTRGFVREYARYLGLNSEEMVNRYNFAAAGDDRIEQSAHLERLAHPAPHREAVPREIPSRARRDIPAPYARVDRNIYGLLIIVAALAGIIYWAVVHKRQTRSDENGSRPVPVARASARPVTVAPAASTTAQPVAAAADAPLHLTLTFPARSWVELEVDGKTVLADDVAKGERRDWDAHDEFRFKRIGNAAGVDLTLNGVHLPSLGGDGKVIHDFVLNRQTLRQDAASAAPETKTETR